jgi:hypothetical protein
MLNQQRDRRQLTSGNFLTTYSSVFCDECDQVKLWAWGSIPPASIFVCRKLLQSNDLRNSKGGGLLPPSSGRSQHESQVDTRYKSLQKLLFHRVCSIDIFLEKGTDLILYSCHKCSACAARALRRGPCFDNAFMDSCCGMSFLASKCSIRSRVRHAWEGSGVVSTTKGDFIVRLGT